MALLFGIDVVFQVPEHHGALTQAIATYRIHVITTVGHGERKTNRFLSAVLANNLGQRLQLPGGFEWQIFKNAGFIELMQGQ